MRHKLTLALVLVAAVAATCVAQSTIGVFTGLRLNGNTISISSGTATITVPNTTGTLATLAGSESLTNKKLGSLTSNGFVKTSGGDGTLSVDTSTYLTSATLCTTGDYCTATVTLTDAQIKALPTTPVPVVAALGAGFYILPVLAETQLDASAGAYTNIDAGAWGGFRINGWDLTAYIVNDATGSSPMSGVTDLLGAASKNFATFLPLQAPDFNGWGPVAIVRQAPGSDINNQPLYVYFDNNGAGNFTGGNAANTWAIRVSYRKVPIL